MNYKNIKTSLVFKMQIFKDKMSRYSKLVTPGRDSVRNKHLHNISLIGTMIYLTYEPMQANRYDITGSKPSKQL